MSIDTISQRVHATRDTHLNTRNLVPPRKVLRVGRTALRRRAHPILVVLTYKHTRQIPQLRHIERLKHLALVARAVAVERVRRDGLLHVLLREGEAGADGNLGTDDAVAAEEGGGEDVHGAALAVGHAALAAEELADDALDGAAAEDGEGVAAVGGDDTVFGGDASLEAY